MPQNCDFVLDDEALKNMVYDLLRKASNTTYKSKEDRKKEIEEQNQDILELVSVFLKNVFKCGI